MDKSITKESRMYRLNTQDMSWDVLEPKFTAFCEGNPCEQVDTVDWYKGMTEMACLERYGKRFEIEASPDLREKSLNIIKTMLDGEGIPKVSFTWQDELGEKTSGFTTSLTLLCRKMLQLRDQGVTDVTLIGGPFGGDFKTYRVDAALRTYEAGKRRGEI